MTKKLLEIVYDDDGGWSITYPNGKWVEGVSRDIIISAMDSLEVFIKERDKILET